MCNKNYSHIDYLADVALLAETISNPDQLVMERVSAHLDNWRACPECCQEAEDRPFLSKEELALCEAESNYLKEKYPDINVGSAKLKHGSPLGIISFRLGSKRLYARRRKADQDAHGSLSPFCEKWE